MPVVPSNSQDRTHVIEALKVLYPSNSGIDPDWLFKKHAFIGRMTHKKTLQGRAYHLPLQISKQHGVSHNPTQAQQYAAATEYLAFDVAPPKSNFARMRIDRLLLRQCKESPEASERFANFFETEMKGAMQSFGDRQAREVIQDGGGSLGQVGTVDFPNKKVYLKHKGLSHLFEIGMALQFSLGDGTQVGHTLLNASAVARITGLADVDGILEFDDATYPLSGIAALVTDAYIFAVGDFKGAVKGAGAWCPKVAPILGDSFYGMDRSRRPDLCAGLRYDGVARKDTFDSIWLNVDQRARRFGLEKQPIHLHSEDMLRMNLSKEGLKETVNAGESSVYKYGYEAFIGPNGRRFVIDDDLTPGEAWCVDFADLWYMTNGDQPKVDDYDNLELIREDENNYRVEFVVDYLVMSPKPSSLMRIQLPNRQSVVG